ncbi:hypothetical protein FRC09_014811 [Ceratobasidium sp. 395]|nr:hypothetical protein FRC09_014811 [Ceratobasidium sp. 395]
MAQYIYHRRKGLKSSRQKAQIRALGQCPRQLNAIEPPVDTTAPKTSGVNRVNSTHSTGIACTKRVSTSSNKNVKTLDVVKRLHKNALQRERRAKLKGAQQQDAADFAYEQLALVSRERDDAERALAALRQQQTSNVKEVSTLNQQIEHLKQQISQASKEAVRMSLEMNKQSNTLASVEARSKEIYLAKEALRKKVERRDRKEDLVANTLVSGRCAHAYSLKDNGGAIRPEVRNILRELACKGVGTEHALDIIGIIAEGLGITVTGSVSARSIARIMLEGLVQARMQIASELDQANHFTICGDGTSIKNHQYEAKSLYIQPRTEPAVKEQQSIDVPQPVFRTLGVQKALNHTAQHQFNGWIRAIDVCCKALTNSSTGQNVRINSKLVAPKLRGVLTDHAADQKRFQELMKQWKRITDRERRAVPVLENMSTEA